MTEIPDEATTYRLTKKSNLWIAFTPSGHDRSRTWQLQVSARSRGGAKTLAALLETTALRPLATVTLRGESYPLTIGWHEMRRGGVLCFGGERKTGLDGGLVAWEMRWRPVAGEEGCYHGELRVRATPRRDGRLSLHLPTSLHRPELWSLEAAAHHGHCAAVARSAYNGQAIGFVMLDAVEGEAGWDEDRGGFAASLRSFPLGGGRTIRFSLRFITARTPEEARGPLVAQYVAAAGEALHPLDSVAPLNPAAAVERLTRPDAYDVKGAERLYLKAPAAGEAPHTYYAGFPYYPLDALKALADWACFHPSDALTRLVRFGAHGIAADFQVMGREGQAEPNKGAFWDKMVEGAWADHAGGATHGIAANARISRALFLLHAATGEPLFRQSALNICQWLILKQNGDGYYDGERVHATRNREDDGKFLPGPCSLDGAEAIRPLVLAFRATANEVFVKAAWKIANALLDSPGRDLGAASPAAVASVITALLALDAEAPNERLRAAVREWGAWLRVLPLCAGSPPLNADGLSSGLYDCAQAGFLLFALDSDPAYLRYAFAALAAVPPEARARSWRTIGIYATALLALTCLLPDARPDFDAQSVALGWRVFAPDPATEQFLRVTAPDPSTPVDFLPLVCRLNDQLLLVILAPPAVEAVTILKNGKRPLVRNLLTGTLDSAVDLVSAAGQNWARVGLVTIDP